MKYFVYCLYKDDNLQYVGSTTKIINRMRTHKKCKDFNSMKYYVLDSKQDMLDFEIFCINTMSPPINKTKPKIQKDFSDLKVDWKPANLDFLGEVPSDHSFYEFCFASYQRHITKVLNIPENLIYNVLIHWQSYDWSYDIINGYLLIKHDNTGKSLSDLIIERGGKSFKDFTKRLEIINNIITAEAYNSSMSQFD